MASRLRIRSEGDFDAVLKKTGLILLGVGLMLPLAARPQHDRDDQRREERREEHRERYYDNDRKDYHEWNESEQRAWHRYWQEQHRAAIDWQRAKEQQRRAYWRWRHEHPDAMVPPPNRR